MQILIYYLAFETIINCNICKKAMKESKGNQRRIKAPIWNEQKKGISFYDIVFI